MNYIELFSIFILLLDKNLPSLEEATTLNFSLIRIILLLLFNEDLSLTNLYVFSLAWLTSIPSYISSKFPNLQITPVVPTLNFYLAISNQHLKLFCRVIYISNNYC